MGWILLFIVLSSPTGRVHWWFNGRILPSHAGDPGSIPGQCSVTVSSPFWPINQGVFLAPAKVFLGCDSSQPSMQKDLCFFLNTGKLRKLKDPWFTLFFSSKSLKCMASLTFPSVLLQSTLEDALWFNGRILPSHAGDPGSISGQCNLDFFLFPFGLPPTCKVFWCEQRKQD